MEKNDSYSRRRIVGLRLVVVVLVNAMVIKAYGSRNEN